MAGIWRVIPGGQRQYEDYTSAGTFVPVVEVTFEIIATGTVGTVKVPMRDYTEDRVRAMIDARATEMSKVEQLEG